MTSTMPGRRLRNSFPRITRGAFLVTLVVIAVAINRLSVGPTTTTSSEGVAPRANNQDEKPKATVKDASSDVAQSKEKAKAPLFHMVFSTGDDTVSTLNMRSIESIFYFHPNARLHIHTKKDTGVSNKKFQPIVEKGYNITIVHFKPDEVLKKAVDVAGSAVDKKAAKEFIARLPELVKEKFWYSNVTNLLRMCVLYLQGGIYMDTDVILINPVLARDDRIDNAMSRNRLKYHCSVMKFTKPANRFLAATISNFLNNYNGTKWGNNGPLAFGRTAQEHPELVCPDDNFDYINSFTNRGDVKSGSATNAVSANGESSNPKCWLNPLPNEAFAPVSWKKWEAVCFSEQSPIGERAKEPITQSYVVHLNNKKFGRKFETKEYKTGSLCDRVLTDYCVLCG